MKEPQTCSCKPSQKWSWLNFLSLGVVVTIGVLMGSSGVEASTPFRFHTFREPESLDPLRQKNSTAGYILQQISSPLLRFEGDQLQPSLFEKCDSQDLKAWSCKLNPKAKFSDGSPLTVKDIADHWEAAFSLKDPAPWAAEMKGLSGASLRLAGSLGPLGLKIQNQNTLRFQLTQPDSEFPWRLTNHLWSPIKRTGTLGISGTGPYRLRDWNRGKSIELEPNPHSWRGHPLRPRLEVLFISEDHLALKRYQNGDLHFLRRLPTLYFKQFEESPDFHRIRQIRFDYLGFSKKFRDSPRGPDWIRFFSSALPFEEMGRLLKAPPRPGCMGIPERWTSGPLCLAKSAGPLMAPKEGLPALTFSQNVDDTRRLFEWLQADLKARFQLSLKLDGYENKMFLDRVDRRQSDFFRKGVAPDRPTCLAVLENFLPGAAENFIDWNHAPFNALVDRLHKSKSEMTRKKLCREALEQMLTAGILLPLGPIDFVVLAQPQWTGWRLNEINQLDLSELRRNSDSN